MVGRRDLVETARESARLLLAELDDGGRRWRHTMAVAARAGRAEVFLEADAATRLRAAAWLHDIGYAPSLQRFGFHPVDGAVHVRDHLRWPEVAGLIAHHSGARFLADARGLSALMQPFGAPDFRSGSVSDALTWADQTTSPDGETVSVEARQHEMLARRGPDSPQARSRLEREPVLIAAVRATEARFADVVPRGSRSAGGVPPLRASPLSA